jgi:hypothetical protein
MNGFTPFLDRLLPKKYGFVPKKKTLPPRTPPAAAAVPSGTCAPGASSGAKDVDK